MNVKVLVRRGAVEALRMLSEGNPLSYGELAESHVSDYTIKVLLGEGLVEVDAKPVVREEIFKVKRTLYKLTDKGRKMLELYASSGEHKDLLKITPNQIAILESLKDGSKRRSEIEVDGSKITNLVKRGFVERDVVTDEEKREVHWSIRRYRITDKGLKALELCDESNIKVLARKGVYEALEALSEGEPIMRAGMKVKRNTIRVLESEGLVEGKLERVLLRQKPAKYTRVYNLTEKGRMMLELYESLGDEELDLLKVTKGQVETLRSLKDGEKKFGELPDKGKRVNYLVRRGLVEKKTVERTEPIEVYGKRHICRITEKGLEAYKILKELRSL